MKFAENLFRSSSRSWGGFCAKNPEMGPVARRWVYLMEAELQGDSGTRVGDVASMTLQQAQEGEGVQLTLSQILTIIKRVTECWHYGSSLRRWVNDQLK